MSDRGDILLGFPLARCQRFVQQRVKQAAAGFVAAGETCFQPVAQSHEFIDLGDDTALFGEGREGDRDGCERSLLKCRDSRSCLIPREIEMGHQQISPFDVDVRGESDAEAIVINRGAMSENPTLIGRDGSTDLRENNRSRWMNCRLHSLGGISIDAVVCSGDVFFIFRKVHVADRSKKK